MKLCKNESVVRKQLRKFSDQEYYHLTEEQVKLVRELHFSWAGGSEIGYDGAPCVGSKRPFGNSDVAYDILEILEPESYKELQEAMDHDELAEQELEEKAFALYERYYGTLAHALQVIVASGSFEPGVYRCNRYCRNYELVTDEKEIFKAKIILGDKHAEDEADTRYRKY